MLLLQPASRIGIIFGGSMYASSQMTVAKNLFDAVSDISSGYLDMDELTQLSKFVQLGAGFYIILLGILAFCAGAALKLINGTPKPLSQQMNAAAQ